MEIISKGLTSDNLTIVEITSDDGKTEKKYFAGIRCGLAWPMFGNPAGYFCLVGQEITRLITGQFPLMILRESDPKTKTLSDLFEELFNQMGVFGSTEIFTDISRKHMDYVLHLDDFKRKKRPNQDIRIDGAPYTMGGTDHENFIHGLNMIRSWIATKALTIPREFSINQQLKGFKNSDLAEQPETKFNAINGLRYVLGAFEVSAIQPSGGIKQAKSLPVEAWT